MKYWNAAFLERLLKVQSTDLKIRKLGSTIQVFHQRSKEEDAELTQLKMEIEQVDENIEAIESQNQMYSTTLEDIRAAIKGLLTTKSGVPKPRTRSSTEALKIEEEKLAALVEETAEQLARLRMDREKFIERAAERSRILEKSQEGPEAEIRKLQMQIEKLEKQREAEIEGLPSMLLKHYDRLRSSRSGIGLTILRDGVCTVCRMQMPTAVISRMSKGERVPVCPACGRMVARIEIVDLLPKDDMDGAADGGTEQSEKKTAAETKRKKVAPGAKTKGTTKESAATRGDSGKPGGKKVTAKKRTGVKTTKKSEPTKSVSEAPEEAKADKKASSKKSTEKKTAAKKSAAKKKATTKVANKKAPAKKSTTKKSAAKKSAAQKTPENKTTADKADIPKT
jgi:predicted  nucleic acid-binding Zn-ribbon protein